MYNLSVLTKKITSKNDFKEIIDSFKLKGETVLVKPNWVGAYSGGYTDAKVLDLLLSSLKGKRVILLESYTFWRTDKKKKGQGDYFSSKEATLETGKQHWDFFKKMDKWFLKDTGIDKVLAKHNAQYLNITNEVWKGNIANPQEIASLVENKFPPVAIKDMYAMIPKSVLELKGSPLISFAKAKGDSCYGASFSIKNLFGLIPDPNRYEKYHGGDPEKLLARSIIDVHKIYQSLFDVKFVVESVFEYGKMNWTTGMCQKIKGDGTIIVGDSGYEVDKEAERKYKIRAAGPVKNLLKDYKSIFKR